jgi:hypothetical protein
MLMVRAVPHLPSALHITPDSIGAVAFCVAAVTGLSLYVYFNRKPNPAEVERLRREFLAERGRITDATLIDNTLNQRAGRRSADEAAEAVADVVEPPPSVLQYQYRVAGVRYESAQDVSSLAEYLRNFRIDLPIQIRYDPHNPGNSIVVSESWSGLRVGPKSSG